MESHVCPHCHEGLATEYENYIKCCYTCRRYGLLRGEWPTPRGAKDMVVDLTDEQISRVLELSGKIAQVKHQVPAPPAGMDGKLELAKNLRESLSGLNDVLLELGALLRS